MRKYGDDWELYYNQWREKISELTSGENNPMYGRHDHVHGLKRFANEKIGKTLEEIHGIEEALEIRRKRSIAFQGEKNPAFGKVYTNAGKSIKGHYKGIFFRSLLEYSFIKHLESLGIDIHKDLDYECFQVKFMFENICRTYKPDFYVISQKIVYEVKPFYVLKHTPALQLAKWDAMRNFLNEQKIKFEIITEKDFPKIDFDFAKQDSEVIWKEETFKYFKNKKNV
jgi:hypothetical protein